jgi:hypothetical protein
MLSDPERERLENRDSLKTEIKAVNDYRVKRKLIKWLEDAPDALSVVSLLPNERLQKDLSDIDVYRLLNIAKHIMWAKKFMAVSGNKKENPDEWKAEGYGIVKPADSIDIARAVLISENLDDLHQFIGPDNPIPWARVVERILNNDDSDNTWKERISPEEKKAVAKLKTAMDDYMKAILEKNEKPPK